MIMTYFQHTNQDFTTIQNSLEEDDNGKSHLTIPLGPFASTSFKEQ